MEAMNRALVKNIIACSAMQTPRPRNGTQQVDTDTKTFQREGDGLYHKQEGFIETHRLLGFCEHLLLVSVLWPTADWSVVKWGVCVSVCL